MVIMISITLVNFIMTIMTTAMMWCDDYSDYDSGDDRDNDKQQGDCERDYDGNNDDGCDEDDENDDNDDALTSSAESHVCSYRYLKKPSYHSSLRGSSPCLSYKQSIINQKIHKSTTQSASQIASQ